MRKNMRLKREQSHGARPEFHYSVKCFSQVKNHTRPKAAFRV